MIKKMQVAVLSLIVGLIVLVFPSIPAQASGDGCGGPRYHRLEPWVQDIPYILTPRQSPPNGTLRLTGMLDYVDCYISGRKVKYMNAAYCYYFMNGKKPSYFNGVTFESHFMNRYGDDLWGDKTIDVDPFALSEAGTSPQKCVTKWLTYEQDTVTGNMLNAWWNISSFPYWTVDYLVRWHDRVNTLGYFLAPQRGNDYYTTHMKLVLPDSDQVYEGPYRNR